MNKRGFTLIELVMVIVILGILASIALPKFIDLTGNSKTNATKAAIGAIRAAVAAQFAGNVTNGNAVFPASISGTMFADGRIPPNQLSTTATATNFAYNTAWSGGGGWLYNSSTGTVDSNDPNHVSM